MANPISKLARQAAHLPGMGLLAVRAEDMLSWYRAMGTSAKRKSLEEEVGRIKSSQELERFARRFFPPSQVSVEIGALLELAARENVKSICEIGTAQGGTCFLLMRGIPGVQLAVGMDLNIRHKALLRAFAKDRCEFHAIEGSSYAAATVERVKHLLHGRQFDLMLIDGDHRYEGVKADYLAYRTHVRPGGLIVFHDIQPTGDGATGDSWAGGVPVFWQEVKKLHTESWEFVEDRAQRGYGLGVVRNTLK